MGTRRSAEVDRHAQKKKSTDTRYKTKKLKSTASDTLGQKFDSEKVDRHAFRASRCLSTLFFFVWDPHTRRAALRAALRQAARSSPVGSFRKRHSGRAEIFVFGRNTLCVSRLSTRYPVIRVGQQVAGETSEPAQMQIHYPYTYIICIHEAGGRSVWAWSLFI